MRKIININVWEVTPEFECHLPSEIRLFEPLCIDRIRPHIKIGQFLITVNRIVRIQRHGRRKSPWILPYVMVGVKRVVHLEIFRRLHLAILPFGRLVND